METNTHKEKAEAYVREKMQLKGDYCLHESGDSCVDCFPIQMSHWLRVLKGKLDRSWYIDDEGHVYDDHEHWFSFDLVTGQPNTEADYQALCNILGI